MRQYLPIVFGVTLLVFLLDLIIQIQSDRPLFDFELVQWIILIDISLLSIAAIHGVLLVKHLTPKTRYKHWSFILIKLFACIASVALISTLLEYCYSSIGYVDDDYLQFGDFRVSPSWSNVIEYAFIALFLGLPIFIWQHRVERLRYKLDEKALVEERLTQLKTQAELQSLQSRINPHFLFNAFNSITSLIYSNPEKAEKMMVELANLFRYSLNSSEQYLVPLREELKMLEAYLRIEKVRFEENLEFQLDIEKGLDSELVPRFLLQPLVENSIKHVLNVQKQIQIQLKIHRDKQGLSIQLSDDGPKFPEELKFGFGLKSTIEKLELLYGENHAVEFVSKPQKQVLIYLGQSIYHEI